MFIFIIIAPTITALFNMFNNFEDEVPAWLSRLSTGLLILAQVMIRGSWDGAHHRVPCSAWSLLVSFSLLLHLLALLNTYIHTYIHNTYIHTYIRILRQTFLPFCFLPWNLVLSHQGRAARKMYFALFADSFGSVSSVCQPTSIY